MERKIFKSINISRVRFALGGTGHWGVWWLRSITETDRPANSPFSTNDLEHSIGYTGYGIFYTRVFGEKYSNPVCRI